MAFDPTLPLSHFIAAAFSYDKPSKLAVAVSGGGDSMALLRLLADWARDEKVDLTALTVDHGLREEAKKEAEFVAQTCAELGVAHQVLHWTDWDGEGNLQAAARTARYDLMATWARDAGVDTIALGHTADDQAETFFMRLARASGIDGLTGMQRRRQAHGVTWVRPLLMQSREELRAYLRSIVQPWVDDPSNKDSRFDRIKARNALTELAPLGIDAHVVGRVMDHLSQVRDVVDRATIDHALGVLALEHGDVLIDRELFSHADPEITRRMMSSVLKWIGASDYGPRGLKLQEFISAIGRGRSATLNGVQLIAADMSMRLTREAHAIKGVHAAPHSMWDRRWIIDTVQGQEVRPLGEAGLKLLKDHYEAEHGAVFTLTQPRETLLASPAVFDGDTLIAAPVAEFGDVSYRLISRDDAIISALLSH